MEGFIVFDYEKKYPEARKELAQWLSEGKIQRKETIIRGGLKAAEQGLVDLYKGINTGKPIYKTPLLLEALGSYTDSSRHHRQTSCRD
jgi:NADPH-dependent curcumin reductase CurA